MTIVIGVSGRRLVGILSVGEIQKKNRQARDERNMQLLKKALKESGNVTYDMR